jgi:hypothetical protein
MIFFILILLAGGLRWAKGPLQNYGDFQVLHTKDRWTGQRWLYFFGGWSELSPPTQPYVLYSGERVPYLPREELEMRREEVLKQPEYERKWLGLQRQISELEVKIGQEPDLQSVPAGEVRTVQQALADANWELNSLYATAEQVLLAEDKEVAKKKELLATGVWGLLLVFTFFWAFHYFLAEVKRWKQVNETYEIVEYVTKNNRYPLGK